MSKPEEVVARKYSLRRYEEESRLKKEPSLIWVTTKSAIIIYSILYLCTVLQLCKQEIDYSFHMKSVFLTLSRKKRNLLSLSFF